MYIHSSSSSENIKWTISKHPICIIPFTGQGGPQVTIPSIVKDNFYLFFTSTLMDLIVEGTNRYAAACIGEQWTPTTTEELCAYMGFMMLMGLVLVLVPSMYDYWQKDEVFHYLAIAGRISRDRFFKLHRFLHFVDNSKFSVPRTPGYDKLGKIRPIITALSERFSSIYTPG